MALTVRGVGVTLDLMNLLANLTEISKTIHTGSPSRGAGGFCVFVEIVLTWGEFASSGNGLAVCRNFRLTEFAGISGRLDSLTWLRRRPESYCRLVRGSGQAV
jgi:hypothetical protein